MAKRKIKKTLFLEKISNLERVTCLMERISNLDNTIPDDLKRELLQQTLNILRTHTE